MGFRQTLDRGDLFPLHIADRKLAGPLRLTVDMNRACAAFPDTAGVLRPRELQFVPDDPEQCCIRRDIDVVVLAIDIDSNHHLLLSC